LETWIKTHWNIEAGDISEYWQKLHSPFFDFSNPLQVEEKPDGEPDFITKVYNPDNDMGFSTIDDRHALKHTLFLVQSTWEVRACVAAYCRTCRTQPDEPKAFVVYTLPPRYGHADSEPAGVALHAIASQWIETLALNYYVYIELDPDQRQRISYLLLWHAVSLPHLRTLIENAFEASNSKPTPDDCAYIIGEIASDLNGISGIPHTALDIETFASLRPLNTDHTILIVPSVSLTPGTTSVLSDNQFNSLFEISDQLLEKNVFIQAFAVQELRANLKTDFEPVEISSSPDKLIKACNTRFAYVFTGQANTSVPNFNFYRPATPADPLTARPADLTNALMQAIQVIRENLPPYRIIDRLIDRSNFQVSHQHTSVPPFPCRMPGLTLPVSTTHPSKNVKTARAASGKTGAPAAAPYWQATCAAPPAPAHPTAPSTKPSTPN